MFERICINRQDPIGIPIDLGFLAEALVFYQHVHVVADPEMFKSLLRICGHEVLTELLEMGNLKIDYAENIPVVVEHSRFTPYKVYDFGMIGAEQHKYQNLIPEFIQELTGKQGKSRRIANRLAKLVRTIQYDETLSKEALADAFDEQYLPNAIRALLFYFSPKYKVPNDYFFRLRTDVQGCRLETNIDFAEVNRLCDPRTKIDQSFLTPAYLLSHIIETRKQLRPAAELSSDIAVSEAASMLATQKFNILVERSANRRVEMQAFQDVVFDDSRCIREAVNNGARNFSDVLQLVKAGAKFKEWLKKAADDESLVKEYCREVTRTEWADKLPPKSVRWAIFGAASTFAGLVLNPAAGAAVGLGLSAGDTFLVDKLIKGWKPTQFVNGPLADFLKTVAP